MSHDGKRLYSSGEDEAIAVWDYTKRALIKKL